jgi:hydrogenase maturation protease
MKAVAVVGLGNVLMADEGVGVRVVQRLEARCGVLPDVEFIDAGAAGMKLLHLMAGRRRVILVDCAFMGAPPGSFRRFTPDEAGSLKALAGFSLHEGDVLSIVRMARRLEPAGPEVVIVGIEPAETAPGVRLSARLNRRMDTYVEAVWKELRGDAPSRRRPARQGERHDHA